MTDLTKCTPIRARAAQQSTEAEIDKILAAESRRFLSFVQSRTKCSEAMQALSDAGGNPQEIAMRIVSLLTFHVRDLRYTEERTKRIDVLRFSTLSDDICRIAERIGAANRDDLVWSYFVQGNTLPLDDSMRMAFLNDEGYTDLPDRMKEYAVRLASSMRPLIEIARALKGHGGRPITVRALRYKQVEVAKHIKATTGKPHVHQVALILNAAAELWQFPRITEASLKRLLNPSKKKQV